MEKITLELTMLMTPPQNPYDAKGDWLTVESEINAKLPKDFKQFIELYGTGAIGAMPIWIYNPFGDSYLEQCSTIKSCYHDLFSESPELQTYPLFPEKNGLLYFGSTGNGDYLHWRTEVCWVCLVGVVHDFGMSEFTIFDLNLTQFLIDLLTQGPLTQAINVFPKSFFYAPVKFTPAAENLTWPALNAVDPA